MGNFLAKLEFLPLHLQKHGLKIVLGLFLIFAALYLHFRILDSDEGFYIVAANVFPTQLPYVDYFFTQSPLTVPFFWIFSHLPFGLLESARAGSLLISIGTILLVFQTAANRWGKNAGILTAFLLALNFSFIQWGVVAKTYAPAMFCIAAFFYSIERFHSTRQTKYLAIAALFVGVGAGFRLILGGLVLPLLYVIRHDSVSRTFSTIILGFVFGFLPMILFVFMSVERFIFDTTIWHTLRTPIPLATEILTELGGVAGIFLGSAGSFPFPFFGNIIVYALAAWIVFQVIFKKIKRDDFTSALLLSLGILFIAIIMTPYAREQYFVILLPVVVLLGVKAWPATPRLQIALIGLLLLPTLLLVAKPIFLESDGLSPSELDLFARWIQDDVPAGTVLFSHDALFPLLSQREPAHDLSMGRSNYANSFAMTRERVDYYHLQNEQKMREILADSRTHGVVVLDSFPFDLNEFGFTKKGNFERYELFIKKT